MKDLYWTFGQYDIVLILEAQDDAAVAELGLSLGKLGNVRTQTMRAFGPAEVIERPVHLRERHSFALAYSGLRLLRAWNV